MSEPLPVKDKIETEKSIKIAAFRKHVRHTQPHKHNGYLEMIYLSKGSGIHGIDSMEYPIEPPVLHIVRQEQVHFWRLESEPEGYVVIIKKSFFEKSLDGELKSLFAAISARCCLRVEDNTMIESVLEMLTRENQAHGEKAHTITEGLLKALLAKILQVAQPDFSGAEAQPGLYRSFLNLLSLDHGVKKTVRHYADELRVTPQNLNAACRRSASQPASGVLSEFVVAEAKRLLRYTDKTISEIAFALEFSDSSHFVKYFRKHAGHTPRKFRTESG